MGVACAFRGERAVVRLDIRAAALSLGTSHKELRMSIAGLLLGDVAAHLRKSGG